MTSIPAPLLSIVVATFNRAALLRRSVDALLAQQGTTPFEVLYVDDGSTDATSEVLARVARDYPHVRSHRIAHTGSPGAPRNEGIRRARGHVIVLIDDDVIVDPDFVEVHAAFHRAHPSSHDAALGELCLSPEVAADPLSLFHSFPYDEVRALDRLNYLFFWTCNVSLKRDVLLAGGLFDESRDLHPYEDMECGWRLERAGVRLTFLPAARGCHAHQLAPADVVAKGWRSGQAQHALLRRIDGDVRAQVRFGILSADLPRGVLLRRLCNRVLFRLADSVPVRIVLRAAMRRWPGRTRWSDLYYYLEFRRGVLGGYRAARRSWLSVGRAPAGRRPAPVA